MISDRCYIKCGLRATISPVAIEKLLVVPGQPEDAELLGGTTLATSTPALTLLHAGPAPPTSAVSYRSSSGVGEVR